MEDGACRSRTVLDRKSNALEDVGNDGTAAVLDSAGQDTICNQLVVKLCRMRRSDSGPAHPVELQALEKQLQGEAKLPFSWLCRSNFRKPVKCANGAIGVPGH